MQYDFKTLVDRSNCGSGKWDNMRKNKPDLSQGIVPFSVADMEFKNPPEIAEGLKKYMDEHILGYTSPTGEYLKSVCAWMQRRHSWHIEPEWVCGTHGVVEALVLAVKAFCRPGDGVIVFTPVYHPFYMSIEKTSCQIKRCPLVYSGNAYTIDFELFEKLAADDNNKMLIMCSPHNPVGRVWTREELKRIADICRANNVRILCDEIHFDIIMPGHEHTVMATVAEPGDNIITCTAPSKTFNLAAMQTSNIIIPSEDDRKKFQEVAGFGGPSALGLEACRIAYTQCEEWLEQMIAAIDENRQLTEDFIAEKIPEIKAVRLEGTYLQWLDCRALGKSKEELEELMVQKAELFMNEGYMFGDEGIGFERMNLAVPKHVLQAALERLEKAVHA